MYFRYESLLNLMPVGSAHEPVMYNYAPSLDSYYNICHNTCTSVEKKQYVLHNNLANGRKIKVEIIYFLFFMFLGC